MKKYLGVIFFLISIFTLKAQNEEGNIGLKGGFSFSTFSGAKEADLSMRTSFNVGVMLETKFNEKISFQPEIVFSSQGSNEVFDGVDYEHRLNYVNLPLLLKFYLSEEFTFDTGVQFGMLISAKQSNTSTRDNDIKTSFKETDYGLVFGLSYKFNNKISLSARYNFGLQNIRNTNYLTSNDKKLKNSVFQLSLGYYFKNNKK